MIKVKLSNPGYKLKLTNPGCSVRVNMCINKIRFNVGQVSGPYLPHTSGVGPQGETGATGAEGRPGKSGERGRVGPQGVQGKVGPGGVDTFLELKDTPRNYRDHGKSLQIPATSALSPYHGSHALTRVAGDQRNLEFTNELNAGSF